jgi:hypothetical protein
MHQLVMHPVNPALFSLHLIYSSCSENEKGCRAENYSVLTGCAN